MKATNIILVGDLENRNLSDFTTKHSNSVEILESDIKKMVKQLADCDLVVTLPNWDEQKINFTAIEIARKIDIQVIHYSRFQNYVQTIND